MDDKLLILILLFLGVFFLASLISSLTATQQSQDSKPVNPNMSEPCPPHTWEPPKQKDLGIVYQCSKCQQIYPRSADPRQRSY